MPDFKRTRNPNELMKTLLSVIEEYDGFIMGLGPSNDFYSFGLNNDNQSNLKISDDDEDAEYITSIRREFFSTLLDTAVGAYHTSDVISGQSRLASINKKGDLSNLHRYIKILADTSATSSSEQSISKEVLLKNRDSKTPGDSVSKNSLASMRYMTREHINLRSRIIDATYIGSDVADGESIYIGTEAYTSNVLGTRSLTYVDEYTDGEKEIFLEEFKIPDPIETQIVNKEGKINPASLVDKKMCAYVIKDSEFNYSKRRVEFLSLFFNGITPLEMSRCTPYIEVTFYHQNFGTHEENFLNPAGYMKFFSNETDSNERQKLQGFAGKTYPINERELNLYDTDIGYMNIFTSPQTMVNANINSEPGSFSLGNIKTNSYNSALDPFAPQATLKNVVLSTVSGGYGFTSNKKGSMAITIHDRSRLKHFAPLISINQLAKSRVKITIGWSHPDGAVDSDNPIGRFLDSMKSTQMYTLVSSNLRFQGNSVEADLQIVSMGNQHIEDVSAAAGARIPLRSIAPAIESIVTSLVAKAKKRQSGIHLEEITYVHPQLELLIQTANAVETVVNAEDYEQIVTKIRANQGGNLDEAIITAIAKMLGIENLEEGFEALKKKLKIESKKDTTTSTNSEIATNTFRSLKLNTGKLLKEKYTSLFHSINGEMVQPDYFTASCFVRGTAEEKDETELASLYNATEGSPAYDISYVSLGKIISNFVAAPLISTGDYSEVQMFFYPLNSAAGAARKYTTASFPFKKEELDMIFEPTISEDDSLDPLDETIKLGTISAKTMFAKIAALTNSTDFSAYGLSEVGTKARKLKYDEMLKQAKKDKKIEEKVISAYFSKFGDKGLTDYNKIKIKEKKEEILKAAVSQFITESFSERKLEILEEIYANDGLGATDTNTFRFPALNIHLEVLSPIRPIGASDVDADIRFLGAAGALYDKETQTEYATGRILRIHVVDEVNIGSPNVDLANQILYGGKKSLSKNQTVPDIISKGINKLSDAELKEYIKRHYATVIYGAGSSTVKSINLSSTTSDRLAQAKMLTFEKNRRSKSVSKNVNTVGESIRMLPATIDMQILGCPLVERGTIIFIDMGTNTDLDNCYVVNSVTHTISSGDFTTSLGLVVGNQGTVINARGNLLQKLNAIVSPTEEIPIAESFIGEINNGPSTYRTV